MLELAPVNPSRLPAVEQLTRSNPEANQHRRHNKRTVRLPRRAEYSGMSVTLSIQQILARNEGALSVSDITSRVYDLAGGRDGEAHRNASRRINALLSRLVRNKQIERASKGMYKIPSEAPPTSQ